VAKKDEKVKKSSQKSANCGLFCRVGLLKTLLEWQSE
jgi:hypothetical protein